MRHKPGPMRCTFADQRSSSLTELIVFYTAFVVLKARNPLSTGFDLAEYDVAEEEVLFQA